MLIKYVFFILSSIIVILSGILLVTGAVYFGRFQRLLERIADAISDRPERFTHLDIFWGIRPWRTHRILKNLAQDEPDPALRSTATHAVHYHRLGHLCLGLALITLLAGYYLTRVGASL